MPYIAKRKRKKLQPFLDLKTWDAKSAIVDGGVKYILAFSLYRT